MSFLTQINTFWHAGGWELKARAAGPVAPMLVQVLQLELGVVDGMRKQIPTVYASLHIAINIIPILNQSWNLKNNSFQVSLQVIPHAGWTSLWPVKS